MTGAWTVAVPPFLVAAAAFIVPGISVILAGWGWRRIGLLFLAPAVSAAILAAAAIAAPLVGMQWSVLPVLVVTLVAAAVAYLLRRWVGPEHVQKPRLTVVIATVGGFLAAMSILAVQLGYVFAEPSGVSQTFDAIVHLNTVKFAVETGNASAFHIGQTSDIPFYPNGWHSLASLVATTTGVPVTVAVNAANIAIGAIAWPASCIALATALFGDRVTPLLASAALSTGFGAFPILLFSFGVLYPNAMAYAILPAGIAAVWYLWLARGTAARTRAAVLLAVVTAGIGLGHPNAFLAVYAFGAAMLVWELLREAVATRAKSRWIVNGSIAAALLTVGVVIWRISRTGYEMSRWGPWQSTAQAFGEAILLSPRQFPITIVVSLLVIVGIVAIIRGPRLIVFGIPFFIATFMFVMASGTGVGNIVREFVTNPWYNDSYRLAALLPIAGIPVAVLGAITIVESASAFARKHSFPRIITIMTGVVAGLLIFSVGIGPNVTRSAEDARGAYALTAGSPLLTVDEAALLARLDETTPGTALIAGDPWTGTSLAYAIGGREVVEKHVFGTRTDDERFLDAHLRDIDSDARVCAAVRRVGVTHVLDFGTQNVFLNPDSNTDHAGMDSLDESEHFELVDSEGSARLFAITGC
ncbi:hypothetical protein J2X85_002356 [Microbacterium trichothecenolyticum]|uniref:DUF6541 family protein n=1 Tax=Microbacterium trichothecenolyticum TaxID=69370 RepID=UPI00285FCEFA|nr:DUF6541 family protein [Microbacterium trichothecenolyticum]MDR7185322.1 hypothetical protein [Microbacterium trichothecenolyticum]